MTVFIVGSPERHIKGCGFSIHSVYIIHAIDHGSTMPGPRP